MNWILFFTIVFAGISFTCAIVAHWYARSASRMYKRTGRRVELVYELLVEVREARKLVNSVLQVYDYEKQKDEFDTQH